MRLQIILLVHIFSRRLNLKQTGQTPAAQAPSSPSTRSSGRTIRKRGGGLVAHKVDLEKDTDESNDVEVEKVEVQETPVSKKSAKKQLVDDTSKKVADQQPAGIPLRGCSGSATKKSIVMCLGQR